ncbi:MAG: hypothetical protein GQ570_11870 [Helicobacteraceae bacterium]|nr:hypothetical protein [Helicobacteraceae bacterium]
MKITEKDNMNTLKHIEYVREASKNGWGLQSHSFIYEVLSGFSAKSHTTIYLKDGIVLKEKLDTADKRVFEETYIKKGSFIEFRFECNFHFRDENDDYYEIDPSIVAVKCIPFAKINEDVRWNNKLNLNEILDKELYTKMD